LKIVPSEIALQGYEWQCSEPSHVFYAKGKDVVQSKFSRARVVFVNRIGEAKYGLTLEEIK